MRLSSFLILFAAFIIGAVPAEAADRRYPVADFDRVIVEGPFDVRIVVGPASRAAAEGTIEALDGLSVEVRGTTLRIRRSINNWRSTPGAVPAPPVVTLSTRTLRSARIIGTGMLRVTGARGLNVDLAADGSSQLVAEHVAADNLSLALRGSGSIVAAGTARALTVSVQGSGSLDAANLVAENATVAAASSGAIGLNVRRAATVTANGLGSVVVAGRPACTVRGAGAAEVRCGGGAR